MIAKLLPVILALSGLGAGVGAGIVLRPEPEPMVEKAPAPEVDTQPASSESGGLPSGVDYVRLTNQFVVPVIEDGIVGSLVVMSLSLEVPDNSSEQIYEFEPKLRDTFLRVLFNYASIGGFSGDFTSASRLNVLRTSLLEAAQKLLGPDVTDVLIIDFVRQDA